MELAFFSESRSLKYVLPEVWLGHRCPWGSCVTDSCLWHRGGARARTQCQGGAYGREVKVGHVHHAQDVIHSELVLGVGQLHRGHQVTHGSHDCLQRSERAVRGQHCLKGQLLRGERKKQARTSMASFRLFLMSCTLVAFSLQWD